MKQKRIPSGPNGEKKKMTVYFELKIFIFFTVNILFRRKKISTIAKFTINSFDIFFLKKLFFTFNFYIRYSNRFIKLTMNTKSVLQLSHGYRFRRFEKVVKAYFTGKSTMECKQHGMNPNVLANYV